MAKSTASDFVTAGPARVIRAARGLIAGIIVLARALRDRQEVKRLIELDDRALKDIGLSRSDVDGALAEPLFRYPSAMLLRSVGRSRANPPARAAGKPQRPVVPVVGRACCA